ncbi:MAG: hypothetical protein AAGA48_31235 [Myxococcota bacterium]
MAGISMSAGCTEYFSVEEACHPNGRVPGANVLDNTEEDALDTMNCYRRLSGLSRASATRTVQEALEGHKDYILQNPDATRLIGPTGPVQYLSQRQGDIGFTGVTIFDRLTEAGYTFTDPSAVSTREYLFVVQAGYPTMTDANGQTLMGGPAMDGLMREHEWRELALQRSWLDGGYVEIPLDETWWNTSGICKLAPDFCNNGTSVPVGFTGRMYYIAVIHTDPPLQRSFSPFTFPKVEQTGVPLFSMSNDQNNLDANGVPAQVQISYPISIFGNAADPTTALLADQNVYGLEVRAAISDNRGSNFVAQVVLPGADPTGVFPEGYNLRRSAAVYINQPFLPLTEYTVTADVVTNEAEYDLRFQFTTAAEDPGVDLSGVVTGGRVFRPLALRASTSHRGLDMVVDRDALRD